jgi:1-acyl-sn-glycerol-3-phosphate acyltransferase
LGLPFFPPQPSFLTEKLIKASLPLIFKEFLGEFSVYIEPNSMQKLETIKNERCLLLPNHPTPWDPWAMVFLSKKIRKSFFYVVAREIFERQWGIPGKLLQRMGCYSVIRGALDKDSFWTTKEILAQNRGLLTIFVEGEISNQNDSLLPLEPGIVQLAFLALQELYKQQSKADMDQLPSLYLCPIAIKYFYSPHGLVKTIENAIQSLEKATGLSANGKGHYERIQALGLRVLEEAAKQLGYALNRTDSLMEQICGLEDFMLTQLEQAVNLQYDPHLRYLGRVRRIRNTVDRIVKEPTEPLTSYQHRLHDHQKALLKNFYWDLDRIVNFIAIYDGYVHPEMKLERYVEVIRRLEKEVFGHYCLQHPRTAVVQVRDPINLKSYFQAFLQDKKKASDALLAEIEHSLYEGIKTAVLPEPTQGAS